MNWYKEVGSVPLGFNDSEILVNDINLKPKWVETPARFSEFHVKRKKDSLLIVIGESWTYGESLTNVATAIKKYDLSSQLLNCFGSRMATAMNTDYYQYAVPGNCNFYMFEELKRILNHVSDMNYKKIYICMQMTEPGREKAISNELAGHPLNELYDIDRKKINFKQWLEKYDEIFFNIYDDIIAEYKDRIVIDAILSKNFCCTTTPKRDYLFRIIETSWIQYSAKASGIKLEMPEFYAVGWMADMKENYSKTIEFDIEFLTHQLDIIEQSNRFLLNNENHCPHPKETAHALWAQFLLSKAGWDNAI